MCVARSSKPRATMHNVRTVIWASQRNKTIVLHPPPSPCTTRFMWPKPFGQEHKIAMIWYKRRTRKLYVALNCRSTCICMYYVHVLNFPLLWWQTAADLFIAFNMCQTEANSMLSCHRALNFVSDSLIIIEFHHSDRWRVTAIYASSIGFTNESDDRNLRAKWMPQPYHDSTTKFN